MKIWRVVHIRDKNDSKLVGVCLINDFSLIADLHVFIYGSAECATTTLECTKVKFLILKNLDIYLIIVVLMIIEFKSVK